MAQETHNDGEPERPNQRRLAGRELAVTGESQRSLANVASHTCEEAFEEGRAPEGEGLTPDRMDDKRRRNQQRNARGEGPKSCMDQHPREGEPAYLDVGLIAYRPCTRGEHPEYSAQHRCCTYKCAVRARYIAMKRPCPAGGERMGGAAPHQACAQRGCSVVMMWGA